MPCIASETERVLNSVFSLVLISSHWLKLVSFNIGGTHTLYYLFSETKEVRLTRSS